MAWWARSTPSAPSCSISRSIPGCWPPRPRWPRSPASSRRPCRHDVRQRSTRWRRYAMSDREATQEVLRLERLRKAYNVGTPTENEVLHGLDLRLQRNDFAALVGSSGSGKSTLLNLIGLLDRPTGGELYLLGEA